MESKITFFRMIVVVVMCFCLGLDLILIKTIPIIIQTSGYFLIAFGILLGVGLLKNSKKLKQPSPKTAMRLWLGWLFSVITFAVTLVLMYKYIANQNLFLFYAVITLYSVDIVLHFIFNIYAAKKQNIA